MLSILPSGTPDLRGLHVVGASTRKATTGRTGSVMRMPKHDAITVEAGNKAAKAASEWASARNESILAFAERHGWTVGKGDSSDYFMDVRVSKGSKFVDLVLWPGPRRDVASARTHTGDVCVQVSDPVRSRVERFLVGMECECVINPDSEMSVYEGRAVSGCPVHGRLT